eukprot:TRINITY_DN2716_c1_g1_i5.p1 TRINITY_DN2716_c1_g1~~TRINITY_DN2716_c1_g1_i5.p1  ORF type:complete len:305 (+),score=-13.88 TRINITY_DN2716_c1_g1_i5:73-987(+)
MKMYIQIMNDFMLVIGQSQPVQLSMLQAYFWVISMHQQDLRYCFLHFFNTKQQILFSVQYRERRKIAWQDGFMYDVWSLCFYRNLYVVRDECQIQQLLYIQLLYMLVLQSLGWRQQRDCLYKLSTNYDKLCSCQIYAYESYVYCVNLALEMVASLLYKISMLYQHIQSNAFESLWQLSYACKHNHTPVQFVRRTVSGLDVYITFARKILRLNVCCITIEVFVRRQGISKIPSLSTKQLIVLGFAFVRCVQSVYCLNLYLIKAIQLVTRYLGVAQIIYFKFQHCGIFYSVHLVRLVEQFLLLYAI